MTPDEMRATAKAMVAVVDGGALDVDQNTLAIIATLEVYAAEICDRLDKQNDCLDAIRKALEERHDAG